MIFCSCSQQHGSQPKVGLVWRELSYLSWSPLSKSLFDSHVSDKFSWMDISKQEINLLYLFKKARLLIRTSPWPLLTKFKTLDIHKQCIKMNEIVVEFGCKLNVSLWNCNYYIYISSGRGRCLSRRRSPWGTAVPCRVTPTLVLGWTSSIPWWRFLGKPGWESTSEAC
jgi:hypothetical protein